MGQPVVPSLLRRTALQPTEKARLVLKRRASGLSVRSIFRSIDERVGPLSILNLLRDVGSVVDQLYGLKEADIWRDCSRLRGPKTMKKIGFIPISCLV